MCRVVSVNIYRGKIWGCSYPMVRQNDLLCDMWQAQKQKHYLSKFHGLYRQQTLDHMGLGLNIPIKMQGLISPNPMVLRLPCTAESSGRPIKTKFLCSISRVSASIGLKWIQRMGISNEFLGDAEAAGTMSTF